MEKKYLFDAQISSQFNFHPFGTDFQYPNSEHPTEPFSQFGSALSLMVSSPSASSSATANFAVKELIGNLGNAGDISPDFIQRSSYMNSPNTSCYSNTPINSPSESQMPIMNNFVKENIPVLRNQMVMNPALAALPTDPGFAERAAKFSCFGNQSFRGRTTPIGINNAEFRNLLMGNGKFPSVSSNPSLNVNGPPLANKNSIQNQMNLRSELSVPEQNPVQEIALPAPNELNSRKRKGFPRRKTKVAESDENLDIEKKSKMTSRAKYEEDNKAGIEEDNKQAINNGKPPEPPKDYIHVRARRGEATDSHSLAERVRREKISERMKLLQDLVPGCNKVTGKALMLDEIINYVQSLQRQAKFLSMKLSTLNLRRNVNKDNLLYDMFQPNGSYSDNIYPVESSASAYHGQQTPEVHNKSVEPLDATLRRNFDLQFSEDDLRSIVQTGLAPNQTSHMKIEL